MIKLEGVNFYCDVLNPKHSTPKHVQHDAIMYIGMTSSELTGAC